MSSRGTWAWMRLAESELPRCWASSEGSWPGVLEAEGRVAVDLVLVLVFWKLRMTLWLASMAAAGSAARTDYSASLRGPASTAPVLEPAPLLVALGALP